MNGGPLDATGHPYLPTAANASILLFRGGFTLAADPEPYQGDVRLAWLPRPAVEVEGTRVTPTNAILEVLGALQSPSPSGWQPKPAVGLRDANDQPITGSQLPPPLASQSVTTPTGAGMQFLRRRDLAVSEFGSGTDLTHVTGLVPNGWTATDGDMIAIPANRAQLRRGRTRTQKEGWIVDLDELSWSPEPWEQLNSTAGYAVTHTVNLRRDDGTTFDSAAALEALDAIRHALSLALGRRTGVILPTGWSGERQSWARWSVGRIDPYLGHTTWLDASCSSQQVKELIGCYLTTWTSPSRQATLRYVTSYYVQALDADPELGSAEAISGLLLLSYAVFRGNYANQSAWQAVRAPAGTGDGYTLGQIWLLMDHFSIPTAVPAAFTRLLNVQQQVNGDGKQRDGLGTTIWMRNKVIHPADAPPPWSHEQWVEAHQFLVHLLELALLAYAGYRGRFYQRTAPGPMGTPEFVPWR